VCEQLAKSGQSAKLAKWTVWNQVRYQNHYCTNLCWCLYYRDHCLHNVV